VPVATSQQPARPGRPAVRPSEPVLITEAEPSLDDQHAARKKRYAITMGVRAVAITLAAVFYHTVWLMLIFAVLGTVLPWIAVVMANDRPPKSKLFRGYDARPDRVLEARPARVIDAD
jgi:Flp pilus assembly protein TadB